MSSAYYRFTSPSIKASRDQLRIRASCALGATIPAANKLSGEIRQTVSVDCLGRRQSSRGIVIATYGQPEQERIAIVLGLLAECGDYLRVEADAHFEASGETLQSQ